MGCWGAWCPGTERANLWGAVSVKPSWSRGALALVSFWVGRFGLEQDGLLARSHQGKISEGGGAAASLEAQESFGLEKSSAIIESNCYPFWDVISSVESSSPPAREDSELSKLPS